jgi:hypothetical protein
MSEKEEAEAHIKEIAKKATEEKPMQSMPDVCETPPSASEPVPIPYPNTATSKDTSPTSKKVKVDGKEVMTKKSSFKKSTGDEAGQSNAKGLNKVLNAVKVTKILNIPLWIWSVGAIVLIIAVWLLVTNSPQPTEPIEHFLD